MYRIPRNDICMADPMPFNQHWEARIVGPIEKAGDLGLALHAAFASFKPGDKIDVCAFDKHDWQHLIEVATYRVASMDDSRIKVLQIGATVSVPKPKKVANLKPGSKLQVVEVDGAFQVQDMKGNQIETFVDRKQAAAFARREGGEGSEGKAGKAA